MATTDIFLKIDGIPGESEDTKHAGEIDVLSWAWGATNSGSHQYGGGGGTGKVSFQDFHFTMKYNKASALLLLRCADGTHIPKAILYARKSTGTVQGGQKEFLEFHFDKLTISSYQSGGSGGGDPIPTDSISFAFEKVKMVYRPQKSDGSLGPEIEKGYDVKKNVAV